MTVETGYLLGAGLAFVSTFEVVRRHPPRGDVSPIEVGIFIIVATILWPLLLIAAIAVGVPYGLGRLAKATHREPPEEVAERVAARLDPYRCPRCNQPIKEDY